MVSVPFITNFVPSQSPINPKGSNQIIKQDEGFLFL